MTELESNYHADKRVFWENCYFIAMKSSGAFDPILLADKALAEWVKRFKFVEEENKSEKPKV